MVPVAAGTCARTGAGLNHRMKTWHIHISGLVQGVGFRPHVYHTALSFGLTGTVSNTRNGVHIRFNAPLEDARAFCDQIVEKAPAHAIITFCNLEPAPSEPFPDFSIVLEEGNGQPALLLTPDYALCADCRTELRESGNRRYRYAFTTCLNCGPRYSIIRALPYERHLTSMAELAQCPACIKEYQDPLNRRHFSQTNSCPHCAIPLHWHDRSGQLLSSDPETILTAAVQALEQGKILAVKGMGGYLLMADATHEPALLLLRQRKQRPAKPFALLYPDLAMVRRDAVLREMEEYWLQHPAGPIVLLKSLPASGTGLALDSIAPGLDKIGVMLPCTPLLQLLADATGRPLVATSANLSGSPIIYQDEEALQKLGSFADFILSYERDIITPQDDSVLQVTEAGQPILLRRSRGLAPNYFPAPLPAAEEDLLAMGGELKSAFALQLDKKIFISQFLGNQESLEAQEAFTHTRTHLQALTGARPALLLADAHPGYYVTREAESLSLETGIPLRKVQHHEAHFAAVLAENGLLETDEPLLGVIWDGTGLGTDGHIWGGEFLVAEEGRIYRAAHLDYFPQLLGDKMSREPRLSALSLCRQQPELLKLLARCFSEREWMFYLQLVQQPGSLLTSSIGRLTDAVAALTGICTHNSYEGEAAMRLESAARGCREIPEDYYPLPLQGNRIETGWLLSELGADLVAGREASFIARKYFSSLAHCIRQVSDRLGIRRIALSGGVFQNALLNDLLEEELSENYILYRHGQLSPNDECISFGQLAHYHLFQPRMKSWQGNREELIKQ